MSVANVAVDIMDIVILIVANRLEYKVINYLMHVTFFKVNKLITYE